MLLILNIIRSMCGYVEFKVTGGNPDKFLNLSVREGYSLWDVRKMNGDLFAKSTASEYKKLHINARKANTKIKVMKKEGIPFFARKYRTRMGIIVGLALFLTVLSVLPLYLWKIEVVGCDTVNPEEVKNVMRDLGVSPGTFKPGINVPILKQQMMQRMDSIAWISINLKGSEAIVEVKEKQFSPEREVQGEPSNIVAQYDGKIERMETYRGTAVVSDGNVVTKDQILISGIVEDLAGDVQFVDAEGKIYAETHRIISQKVNMKRVGARNVGDEIRKYRVKIFGLEIPICFGKIPGENCICETNAKIFKIFGYNMPLCIYKDSIHMQEVCEEQLSEEEAEKEADKLIDELAGQKFGEDVKIKSIDRKPGIILPNGEEYYRECHYDLVENISKKERIVLDN